jgi:hypothetical protein
MGEIDDVQNAINQRQPKGCQYIQGTIDQANGQALKQQSQTHG